MPDKKLFYIFYLEDGDLKFMTGQYENDLEAISDFREKCKQYTGFYYEEIFEFLAVYDHDIREDFEQVYKTPITQLQGTEYGVAVIKIETPKDIPRAILIDWMYRTYRDPHQIHSQYDCTGKKFVQFVILYPDPYNEHNADYDEYLIEQRWAVDI